MESGDVVDNRSRKNYEKPMLTYFGKVKDLTEGGSSKANEANSEQGQLDLDKQVRT